MEPQEINSLLDKYKEGIASPAEIDALHNWYREKGYVDGVYPDEEVLVKERIHNRLIVEINPVRKVRLWPRIAVAAAAVAVITLGVWFYNISNTARHPELVSGPALANDIAPGKNTATLTLADGKVIHLDTNRTSVVVADSVKTMTMLTASTPRGGTYQVTLPDGTKVWLNADSKISFPSQFTGKERKILMEGEAYFEVYKDKRHPFVVETNRQTIEVLGTHFNVSAYAEDKEVITTLIEGKVKVTGDGNTLTLDPGDQAYSGGDGIRGLRTEDPEAVIAWKNGQFMFADEDLMSIMRKVARWYDVEVVYQEGFVNRGLVGTISKFENVSKVLKMLELTGTVHFKVEGRRITVMK